VIPDVLKGRDVLVKSPTGSGKTFAFGLPMIEKIERGGAAAQALVLAPTRELASQIVDELSVVADAHRVSMAAVYGGANIGPQMKRARHAEVLVATPGRLIDLIERKAVSLRRVQIVILDEADRMLDMGFKPVVERLMKMTPDDRQTLLFSATLDGAIGQIANQFTRDAVRHEHAHAAQEQGKIEHRFHRVEHAAKTGRLIDELSEPGRGRTLVFVRTKHGADKLAKKLDQCNIRVAAMHGNKSQAQREKALARFEDGRIDTLVATDVAARGIDVSGVTHVINYDVPGAKEDYVHRVGRTARAGASGIGITYVMADQVRDVVRFAGQLGLHAELAAGGLRSHDTGGNDSRRTRPQGASGGPRGGGHRGNGGKPRNGSGGGKPKSRGGSAQQQRAQRGRSSSAR
ncbi:MAG TPA: DEAD/DEAH box helicase, partial [Baekduia sp.]|nr:DEAD/DEAH box helicase [Baekduia sp.]